MPSGKRQEGKLPPCSGRFLLPNIVILGVCLQGSKRSRLVSCLLRSPSCISLRQSCILPTGCSSTPLTNTPLLPSLICRFSLAGFSRSCACRHHVQTPKHDVTCSFYRAGTSHRYTETALSVLHIHFLKIRALALSTSLSPSLQVSGSIT